MGDSPRTSTKMASLIRSGRQCLLCSTPPPPPSTRSPPRPWPLCGLLTWLAPPHWLSPRPFTACRPSTISATRSTIRSITCPRSPWPSKSQLTPPTTSSTTPRSSPPSLDSSPSQQLQLPLLPRLPLTSWLLWRPRPHQLLHIETDSTQLLSEV